ncbi:alpha/beta hydrolase [Williamsoniiplasma lucivorax]|uniref:Alpha/beta hydrolase n=1 Tax=Williamsoniiplasma lucivorax TaxID=209274 RepID=A0A2S5R9E8_9MOLU|nr:alpha/beta fold hydrolase [Williamsoniiplasma lucivorax]PPE03951.1 alpha/beta hydrolase [Williamsoniiplasma lucivorax]
MAISIENRIYKKMFKKINLRLIKFFNFLGTFFIGSRNSKTKNHVYFYPEIKHMNKVMKKLFKQPQLQLSPFDNLIPFKFETDDHVILSGLQYISNPDSEKWLIACHGFGEDKYWALYATKPFIELGYNILVFDFRNHGESEKNQPVTMGILEQKDLLAAMQWLNENKKYKHLGLLGISMGAFVINIVQAKDEALMKKYLLKFSISDVTYGSIQSLLLHIRNMFFKRIFQKKSVIKKIKKIIECQNEETKLNWNEINIFKLYEKDGKKSSIPTLFTHGLNDLITPPTDSYRLFADRKLFSPLDEILIYDFSAHGFSLKEHFISQAYHWIKFENKVIGTDKKISIKALENMGIDENTILNNKEEKYEINTFYFSGKE